MHKRYVKNIQDSTFIQTSALGFKIEKDPIMTKVAENKRNHALIYYFKINKLYTLTTSL